MDIKRELDILANTQAHLDSVKLEKQALIDALFTPEIKAEIAEIELEFASVIDPLEQSVQQQTEYVKRLVVEAEESVKGTFLYAVYAKGRVSWDSKSLDGYAVAHPEINAMRKQGEPTVSIRKV